MDAGTVATSVHTSPTNGQLAPSPVANTLPSSGGQMYAGRQLTSADVSAITEAGSKGGVFMVNGTCYFPFYK